MFTATRPAETVFLFSPQVHWKRSSPGSLAVLGIMGRRSVHTTYSWVIPPLFSRDCVVMTVFAATVTTTLCTVCCHLMTVSVSCVHCLQAEAVLTELQPLLSSPSDITVICWIFLSLFWSVLPCSIGDSCIAISHNLAWFAIWRSLAIFVGVQRPIRHVK